MNETFQRLLSAVAASLLTVVLAGCSGDDDSAKNKDHVFKETTQTIDRAREVEGILKDAAEKQKKAAEEAGG
jgi:hypothetical protein